MPSIPNIDIRPGVAARVPSTTSVVQAFEAQLQAEQAKKSPLQSFAEGVGTAQKLITNQQAIQINELEKERLELANSLKREQQAEDVAFTRAIKSGSVDDQANALLSTPAHVLTRNRDAAIAVMERVRQRGTPEQQRLMTEEVMPILDRDRLLKEQAAEERQRREIELIRERGVENRKTVRESAELKRKTPEELEHERTIRELDRRIKEANARTAEAKAGGELSPQKKTELQLEKEKQQSLIEYLRDNGEPRKAQELSVAAARRTRLAQENPGVDELALQKEVTKQYLGILDREERAEAVSSIVRAAQQQAASTIGSGAGRGALAGFQAAQPQSLAALEEDIVQRGINTKEEIDLFVDQEVARLKAQARVNNQTIKASEAVLREAVRRRVLLELQKRNP